MPTLVKSPPTKAVYLARTITQLGVFLVFLTLISTPSIFAQLKGEFDAIGPVPAKGSLTKVKLEEFFNFTCPHCNNFRVTAKPLFSKYKAKIDHQYVPVLFRGQSDNPLRLYFIAEKEGKGAQVRELIFDATFKYGVNINDPTVVTYLAKSAGLGEQFLKHATTPWVEGKILDAQRRAAMAGVEATPTVVLAGSLRLVPNQGGMDHYVNNMESLIQQMLK